MRGIGRQWGVVGIVGLVLLACAAPVRASTVTVGSPMTIPIPEKSRVHFPGPETIANVALAQSGASVTSPISGTVVRWRMAANYLGGPFALRVLKPDSSGDFFRYGALSASVSPTAGPQTITTSLPIQAGDLIALEVPSMSAVPFLKIPSSRAGWSSAFSPPVPEGEAWGPMFEEPEWEFGFNADVQPPPTLGVIAPSAGSVAGGATVTMTGSDFEGASAVKFGNVAAQSFMVSSETQLTAVAPPSAQVATVSVSVTTPAGVASSPSGFTYDGCTVPDVARLKLSAAKKAIRAANCAVGHVRKKKDRRKVRRVLSQQPVAGSVRPPGSKVALVLGAQPASHHHSAN